MENNQNPPPNNIKEALDQLFEHQKANPPSEFVGQLTIEKILDRCFISIFEMQPGVPHPILPERLDLHNRPPGRGAIYKDWERYLRREAQEVMPTFREGRLPIHAFGWILKRFTSEEKANFVDAVRASVARQRELRNR